MGIYDFLWQGGPAFESWRGEEELQDPSVTLPFPNYTDAKLIGSDVVTQQPIASGLWATKVNLADLVGRRREAMDVTGLSYRPAMNCGFSFSNEGDHETEKKLQK